MTVLFDVFVLGRSVGRVVDDAGRTLELSGFSRRIVSLVPSVTETIVALGAAARLVARTRYDLDPALAQAGDGLREGRPADVERDVMDAAGFGRGAARVGAAVHPRNEDAEPNCRFACSAATVRGQY